MSCEVSEEQLFSWIDRNAPELEEHLAVCEHCRARAPEFRAAIKTIQETGPPVEPGLPDTSGSYTIRAQLGEGGFGIVYLAEQHKPVRRSRVAVKVIKPGMDSKAVIARFRAEEQALALMNHPNIARVLDAGTTDQGRPYFVMEYVPKVPITEHCDRAKGDILLFVPTF